MPFISVIIPAYNSALFIDKAIRSVFDQSYTDYEVICIDNNSGDSTWDVLLQLQKVYPGLIITKEEKQGASAARNKGISMAKGEWIQFLDADDIILPGKLKRQTDLLKTDASAILIVGSYQIVDVKGERSVFTITTGNKWEKLTEGSLGCTISNLFQKRSVIAAGGWDEKQKSSQEFKLMFDIMKTFPASGIIYDKEANAVYQKRAEGSISNNYSDNITRFLELRNKIWLFLKESGINDVHESFYLNAVFHKLRLLYKYNPEKAMLYYKKYIPASFVPAKSILTPLYYIILYRFLGFKQTEQLIKKARFK